MTQPISLAALPIRVMLVQSDPLFGECLRVALVEQGFQLAGLVTDPQSTLEEVNRRRPTVVLIDYELVESGALDLTRSIRQETCGAKVIIIGLEDNERLILSCVEAGASGYVIKGESLKILSNTIHAVYHGETICSPRIAYRSFRLLSELSRLDRNKQLYAGTNLTVREIEILELIGSGLRNKQIAERLCLSTHTVKNHVHNLLEKLCVGNRWEAANYVTNVRPR
jgi:DNA-binding NarL/FixJ family response regulator